MKIRLLKIYLILILFLLIFNAVDFYIIAGSKIGKYPEPLVIKFFSDNNLHWHTYYYTRKFCVPVGEKLLSGEKITIIKSFFKGRIENSFNISYHLAPVLSREGKGRSSFYMIQRLRDYRNMILISSFYSEKRIITSLLNWKKSIYNAYGAGILSEAIYDKKFEELEKLELLEILNFMFGKDPEFSKDSRVNNVLIKEKLHAYLEKKNRNFPDYGGNFRDYCLSILKSEGLIPISENINVYTTINTDIQKNLEQQVVDFIVNRRNQDEHRIRLLNRLPPVEAASAVIKTLSGEISGLIGSVRYSEENVFNRGVNSRRQISSTFKPFLYILAIEKKGYNGKTKFIDKPVTMKNRDGTPWEPGNFYPYYLGEVSFKDGLVISINTIAVQLIQILGVETVAEKAREVFRMNGNDIESRILDEPSLSLGSIDLTPLEVAKGYLAIASLGLERIPYPIRHVKSENGDMILDYADKMKAVSGKRVFSREASVQIRDILKEVITRGTASTFILEPFTFDVAGKSGSSPSDSWFAGFNSRYLLVTWAGYDRPAMSSRGKLPEFIVIPFWYSLMNSLEPGEKNFER